MLFYSNTDDRIQPELSLVTENKMLGSIAFPEDDILTEPSKGHGYDNIYPKNLWFSDVFREIKGEKRVNM